MARVGACKIALGPYRASQTRQKSSLLLRVGRMQNPVATGATGVAWSVKLYR